uniref:Small ribosomal subunit protein bS18m n=3 Tax=Oncorhynchus tshawytscha TaxID=74940 RepID=A0AAZ3SQ34_ONCTS
MGQHINVNRKLRQIDRAQFWLYNFDFSTLLAGRQRGVCASMGSKMFAVRSFRSLQFTFSQLGGTQQCLRSLSGSSNVVQKNDDMPLQMENPYKQPQKGCILCNITVDFKNVQLLSQFISPHTGRVYGRHITGLCGKKQREIAKAIKKAHSMGFMSVTHKDPHFMKDPNICDIRHLE